MADSKMVRFTPRRGWGFTLFGFEDLSDVSKCDGSPNDSHSCSFQNAKM